MLDWILQNKTWLFSGAGLTVLGMGWWLLKKLFPSNPVPPSNPSGPPNVNVTVSPAISPVFSQTQSNAQNLPSIVGGRRSDSEQSPNIRAITFEAVFAQAIGRNCFILTFRNDGFANATNVIAHITYVGNGRNIVVDYGCWVEHELILNIFRGHTKHLVVALTDTDGKNFAVNDIGPATNYTQAQMVSVGELTPGDWKMTVTLSADNFRENFVFDFRVVHDGSIQCNPEGMNLAPKENSSDRRPSRSFL